MKSNDAATKVYLIVSFESDHPLPEEMAVEAWRQYCATLREVVAGVPSVSVRPDVLNSQTFQQLDLRNNSGQAIKEAVRAKADLVLRNYVNIQETGDMATRNIVAILEVHSVKRGALVKVAQVDRLEGRFSHVKYLALQAAWAFLTELKTNERLVEAQPDRAVERRVKENLLTVYSRFLQLDPTASDDLRDRIQRTLPQPDIRDVEVDELLQTFKVPHSTHQHASEEDARRRRILAQLQTAR